MLPEMLLRRILGAVPRLGMFFTVRFSKFSTVGALSGEEAENVIDLALK